jgi:hypothetical protein
MMMRLGLSVLLGCIRSGLSSLAPSPPPTFLSH